MQVVTALLSRPLSFFAVLLDQHLIGFIAVLGRAFVGNFGEFGSHKDGCLLAHVWVQLVRAVVECAKLLICVVRYHSLTRADGSLAHVACPHCTATVVEEFRSDLAQAHLVVHRVV